MRAYTLTVSGSTILSGSLDSTSPVTASYFKGDGSAITGVTAEWDGTHTGNGNITGTLTFGSLSDGTITTTAFESSLTSGATLIPTSAAVKTYVDSQVTAQDLDFQGDSGGALSIDLDSESLTIAGGTNTTTVGSGNGITINVDDSFLINSGNDTTSGTITAAGLVTAATGSIAYGVFSNKVGIGTTSPVKAFDLEGGFSMFADGGTGVDSFAAVSHQYSFSDENEDAIWFYDSSGHVFSTDGSERISITAAGKIGIGETSPDSLLHITKDGVAELKIEALGNANSKYPKISFYRNNAQAGTFGIEDSDGGAILTGTAGGEMVIRSEDEIWFGTAGNYPRMVIKSDGKVGIGTTSPTTTLSVGASDSSAAQYMSVDAAAGQEAGIMLKSAGGIKWYIYRPPNSSNLNFYDSSTVRVTFENGGNVGIGTASPQKELHVNGTIRTGPIWFYNADTTLGGYIADGANMGAGYTSDDLVMRAVTDIGFLTNDASTKVMILKSDGKVGIGTTSPVAKLEIEGGSAAWNETTPGTTVGSIHLDPGVTTDHFGSAITWGASDSGDGDTAQAGIYVRSDGGYGTKMYFATTGAYGTGSTTALRLSSDQSATFTGNVIIPNATGALKMSGWVNANIISSQTNYIDIGADTQTMNVRFPEYSSGNHVILQAGLADNNREVKFRFYTRDSAGALVADVLKLNGDGSATFGGSVAGTFVGNITGNVTGNTSGTALTVTQATQTAITSLGTLTTLTVDDMTLNGSTISDGGDLTLDIGGDIILDADGGDVLLKDGGTQYAQLTNSSGNLRLKSGSTTMLTGDGADATFSGAVTITGGLTVNGTTTTVSTTNMVVADNMIELNNGAGSNANDSGIVIERGSTGDNAIFVWDESADGFIAGTTTATGASTGNLTIAAAPLQAAALTATTITSTAHTINNAGGQLIINNAAGSTEYFRIHNNDLKTPSGTNIHLQPGGSNALRLNGSDQSAYFYGKVGIGIASPSSFLHLQSSTSGEPKLILHNSNTGASQSSWLAFEQGSTSQADGQNLGYITFSGLRDNDSGQETMVSIAAMMSDITLADAAGELRIQVGIDNAASNVLTINGYNGTVGQGYIVFNEDSKDFDFRVESDNNANAFFIEGSSGKVGIGTASPQNLLNLSQANGANIRFDNETTSRYFVIGEGVGTNDKFSFRGLSYRSTDTLTVDFANNRVGVATISPAEALDVVGDIKASVDIHSGEKVYVGTNLRVAGSGNASDPVFTTSGDTNTGIYFGTNKVGIGGSVGLEVENGITATTGTFSGDLRTSSGKFAVGSIHADARANFYSSHATENILRINAGSGTYTGTALEVQIARQSSESSYTLFKCISKHDNVSPATRFSVRGDGLVTVNGSFDVNGNSTFAGSVNLAATNGLYLDGASGHTFIAEYAANKMQLQAGGVGSMILDGTNAAFRVGIGTSTPQHMLHVYTSSAGTDPSWDTNNNGARNLALFETGENEGAVTIFSPSTGVNMYYAFADPGSRIAGAVKYSHGTDKMTLITDDEDALVLDSSTATFGGYIIEQGRQDHVANTMPQPYYHFDGVNDKIASTVSSKLNFYQSTKMTMMVRFKAGPTPGLDSPYLFAWFADSSNSIIILYPFGSGTPSIRTEFAGSVTSANLTGFPRNTDVNVMVLTVSGNQYSAYYNGKFIVTVTGQSMANCQDVNGKAHWGESGGSYWEGSVYQSQIWNTVLTDTEIKEISSGASVPFKYKGASQTEILADGGFETWGSATNLTHWAEYNAGSSTTNRDSDDEESGTYCVRLDVSASDDNVHIYSVVALFVPGRHYRVTFSAKCSSGTCTASVYESAGSTVPNAGLGEDLALTTSYQQFSFEFTALGNSGASQNLLFGRKLGGGAASKSLYFDNASVTQIGAVAEYDGGSAIDTTWYDKSGNNLDGTVSGASIQNRIDALEVVGVLKTGDIELENERGHWKIVEESEYLSITNVNTNKKYKLLMEEIE